MGLARDTEQWFVAKDQAVLEINAAAKALFEAGVQKVGLWDNHGGGNNIDPSALDPKITLIPYDFGQAPRMSFANGEYDCICFFGYHAMEGTLGGVLAHTINSKVVQYYKLNGHYIGEVDMDAYIAASKGMPTRFFAGGNIACEQAKRAVRQIVTVEAKKELSRNEAIFRNNDELLAEIGKNIVEAVKTEAYPYTLEFPSVMEKSFKRTEDAAKYLSKMRSLGMDSKHPDDEILGKDSHTVVTTIYEIDDLIKCI